MSQNPNYLPRGGRKEYTPRFPRMPASNDKNHWFRGASNSTSNSPRGIVRRPSLYGENTSYHPYARNIRPRGASYRPPNPNINTNRYVWKAPTLDNSVNGQPRYLPELVTNPTDANETIVQDISTKLGEPKKYIIEKVVEIVGKEKAIILYNKTKMIEANGGQLVHNLARRRTPGGLYITLLKSDSSIPQDLRNKVFAEIRAIESNVADRGTMKGPGADPGPGPGPGPGPVLLATK